MTRSAFGFSRVSIRIIVLISLLGILTTFVITAFNLHQDYNRYNREIQEQFSRIENVHLPSLVSSMWVTDYQLAATQLDGLIKYRDIAYAAVHEEGRLIASAGEMPDKNAITRELTLSHIFNDRKHELGTLHVVADGGKAVESVKAKALSIMTLQAVQAFFMAGFLYLIFHFAVARHLTRIARHLGMLDVSRLAEPLALHRNKSASAPKDELDEVAEAINGMSENLRDSYARLNNELERRKITEARLKAAYDEMEAKVRERTQELSRAMKQAESASNAKSQFLADMSHEVRTPLNGVLGMLHVLRDSPLGPHQKKHVDMALSAGNSLLAVINDILDFSKIEAGMIEMENSVFSLRDVLEQVNAVFEHDAKPKGLHLAWRLDGRIPELVAGDQARLRQILFNLIGNAVKFTPSGEVLTEVYPLDSKSDGPLRLLFAVSDTGIGIPGDNLPHIFDKFTQFEGGPTVKLQGTGLGLGIVKRLVKLMNGAVDVDSKEGSGTTVYFCLDLGRHSASENESPKNCAASANDGQAAPSPAKLRILLAEDNLINRIAAQTLLERMGHTVKCAEDGNQALQLLAVGDFDLVLMDIQMPVMDGLEATRIIRGSRPSDGIDPKIPIIAMTAHTMKGDREAFLAEGMDDYIPKPFAPDVVAGVLARYAPDCRS